MSSSSAAIWINSSKHNDIYNNYIGLTASGTKLGTFSREGDGIWIQSSDSNYVGDTTKFPNFICNTSRAIYFTGGIANGYGNEIANNVIGLGFNMFDTIPNTNGIITSDAICKHNIIGPQNIIAGTIGNGINIGPTASNDIDSNVIIGNTIAGNYMNGIFLTGNIMHTIIGGSGPDDGNYIYNNGGNGIYIYENSDSNQVIGNHIGGDIAHPNRFNGATGVMIDYDCDGNLVDSNFIAYNGNDGVSVMINGILNNITRNCIYKNGDIGIDLDDDGVTLNDIGDGDSGPNDLLNFPEVDSVRYDTSDSTFVIYGTAKADARVEAFLSHPANDTLRGPDLSGYGEAYEYIGFTTANGTGDFNFKVAKEFPMFSDIAFTASDVDGNTSEFSANIVLDQAPLIIVGYSPINFKIIDPVGDSIGKTEDGTPFNTIGDATYDEAPNDSVNIAYPLDGDYTIIVLPEIGAPSGAVYSVGIRIDGSLECIQVENADVPASGTADTIGYVVEESYHYENGDANGDNTYNLLDILLLIDCIYGTGEVTCPDPYFSGDANCDRVLNLIDILYLIDHVYGDPPGPAPCILE